MEVVLSILLIVLSLSGDDATLTPDPKNILIINPLGTKSHMSLIGEVANILTERGHEVTFFKSYEYNLHTKMTIINAETFADEHFASDFKKDTSNFTMDFFAPLCADALKKFHESNIDVNKFDLVLINYWCNECFYSLLDKVPFILLSSNAMGGYLDSAVGNVDFPAFLPMIGLQYRHPMTFLERTVNILAKYYIQFIYMPDYYEKVYTHCHEAGYCKFDTNQLYQLSTNASLVFLNSVRSLETPARPYMPTVIHVGGLNCRPAAQLSKHLLTWIEGAGDAGVIFFSLGSVLKISDLPKQHLNTLMRTFAKLPQRVIFKSDVKDMENLPNNVLVSDWLPQQDIIGHPNVVLFMTHGGLFSKMEAMYHGVPVLCLPVTDEQDYNVATIVSEGWGETVSWDTLEENLEEHLEKVLSDPRYRSMVQQKSMIMKDEPMSPRESVVYWTEHVIRTKGARHLRSPLHQLTWYTLYNVDVWCTIALLGVLLLILFAVIIGYVCRVLVKLISSVNIANVLGHRKTPRPIPESVSKED